MYAYEDVRATTTGRDFREHQSNFDLRHYDVDGWVECGAMPGGRRKFAFNRVSLFRSDYTQNWTLFSGDHFLELEESETEARVVFRASDNYDLESEDGLPRVWIIVEQFGKDPKISPPDRDARRGHDRHDREVVPYEKYLDLTRGD